MDQKAPPPIADHFDRFAPTYDRVNHLLSLGLDVRWRERLMAALAGRPPLTLLDLCAGTLACTREALRRFPKARVTAVDLSRRMLEWGWARLDGAERERLTLICADLLEAEIASGAYDAVLCSFGMRHLPDQTRVLERIQDWLAPGGRFFVFDFFRPSAGAARVFHATAGKYLLPLAGGWLGGFGPAYAQRYESIEEFLSRAGYERLLARHGFKILRAEDWTFGIVSLIVSEPISRSGGTGGLSI